MSIQFEINVRLLKAVACQVSTEETRYYLCGVNVEFLGDKMTMTATDGHGMIVAQDKCNGVKHPAIIIPSSLIAKIKLHRSIDEAVLSIDGGKITIDYVGETIGGAVIDGTFPDYRRIIPKDVTGETAQFAVEQSAVFLKARQTILNKKKTSSPAIHHNGMSPAIVDILEGEALGNVRMIGVLMPMRNPSWKAGLPTYSWATEYPAPTAVETSQAA